MALGDQPPEKRGEQADTWNCDLVTRFQELGKQAAAPKEELIFQQKRARGKPLWDSGMRDALHQAAKAENCNFDGLRPHSFRRANITWRQQVGGSAIEASKIAGHSDLEMTGEYTVVAPERQNELTRRIQERIATAAQSVNNVRIETGPAGVSLPEPLNGLAGAKPSTPLIQ